MGLARLADSDPFLTHSLDPGSGTLRLSASGLPSQLAAAEVVSEPEVVGSRCPPRGRGPWLCCEG